MGLNLVYYGGSEFKGIVKRILRGVNFKLMYSMLVNLRLDVFLFEF